MMGLPEYGDDGRVDDVHDAYPAAASTLSQFWPRSWVKVTSSDPSDLDL
jgi:hypothetical protein